MLTAIEEFLFGGDKAHHVLEFSLSWKRLVLTLVSESTLASDSWDRVTPSVVAEFEDASIKSVDVSYCDPEDLNPPWAIIGFECRQCSDSKWEFAVHTSGGEYCFEARWPRLARKG